MAFRTSFKTMRPPTVPQIEISFDDGPNGGSEELGHEQNRKRQEESSKRPDPSDGWMAVDRLTRPFERPLEDHEPPRKGEAEERAPVTAAGRHRDRQLVEEPRKKKPRQRGRRVPEPSGEGPIDGELNHLAEGDVPPLRPELRKTR